MGKARRPWHRGGCVRASLRQRGRSRRRARPLRHPGADARTHAVPGHAHRAAAAAAHDRADRPHPSEPRPCGLRGPRHRLDDDRGRSRPGSDRRARLRPAARRRARARGGRCGNARGALAGGRAGRDGARGPHARAGRARADRGARGGNGPRLRHARDRLEPIPHTRTRGRARCRGGGQGHAVFRERRDLAACGAERAHARYRRCRRDRRDEARRDPGQHLTRAAGR